MATVRSEHHSNPLCEDCGHRHNAGAFQDCIECLKAELEDARADTDQLDTLTRENEALAEVLRKTGQDISDFAADPEGEFGPIPDLGKTEKSIDTVLDARRKRLEGEAK